MMMTRALIALLGLSVIFGISGCEAEEETEIQIVLYSYRGDPEQANLLNPGGPANELEMILVNMEDRPEPEQIESVSLTDQRASFNNLPYDTPFRLLVRGLFQDASGASSLQFYGASAPFEVQEGEETIVAFQVGRANCVTLNQGSNYIDRADGNLTEDAQYARVGSTATRLSDGRVVIIGGGNVDAFGSLTEVYSTIEIYEPRSGRFSLSSTQLLQGRAYHTATLLPNDEILLVGGVSGVMGGAQQVMSSASIVRFGEDRQVFVDPVVADAAVGTALARYHHQAVTLSGDGSVLLIGGFDDQGQPLATTLRYFPSVRGFIPQRPLSDPRARFAAESYGSSHAVVAGGLGQNDAVLNSLEVFINDPSQMCSDGTSPSAEIGCFIKLPNQALAQPRWGLASVLIDDGNQVLFIGGHTDAAGGQGYHHMEIFNVQFSSLIEGSAGGLVGPVGRLQATLLKEGDILVTGGRLGDSLYNVAIRLQPDAVDPATQLTTHFAAYELTGCGLSEPRAEHNATLLQSGVVLMTGGFTGPPTRLSASRRTELYFPGPLEITRFYAP